MNNLLNTEFWDSLTDNTQEVPALEMKNAYGHFVKHVKAISSSNNNTNVFRMLNITRAELVFLSTQIQHEQGKKCPEIRLSSKSTIFS